MKRTINLLAILATFVVFAAPALAQTDKCTEEFKTATYKKYYDNRKDKQDVAFQAAEEWIANCPTDESAYAAAIKKFHAAYKQATGTDALKKQFEDAYIKKNYADQIRLGKQLIAVEPDNPAFYIIMGNAGLGDRGSAKRVEPVCEKSDRDDRSGQAVCSAQLERSGTSLFELRHWKVVSEECAGNCYPASCEGGAVGK